jgi:hypothetical protein
MDEFAVVMDEILGIVVFHNQTTSTWDRVFSVRTEAMFSKTGLGVPGVIFSTGSQRQNTVML